MPFRSSRLAFLRLALVSFLCLLVFALSSSRFPQAQASGGAAATTKQQKRPGGKQSETTRADDKASERRGQKSASKGVRRLAAAGNNDVQPATVCAQNQPITFGQTINGTLANGDCLNPIPDGNGNLDGTLADEYTFSGTAGQQIAISMSATAFDPFLYLLTPNGSVLEFNDDVNPNGTGRPPDTDSRIPAPTGFVISNAQ